MKSTSVTHQELMCFGFGSFFFFLQRIPNLWQRIVARNSTSASRSSLSFRSSLERSSFICLPISSKLWWWSMAPKLWRTSSAWLLNQWYQWSRWWQISSWREPSRLPKLSVSDDLLQAINEIILNLRNVCTKMQNLLNEFLVLIVDTVTMVFTVDMFQLQFTTRIQLHNTQPELTQLLVQTTHTATNEN